MTVTTRLIMFILVCGLLLVSCAGNESPMNVTQHTDINYITGIAYYQGDVYCGSKGGLVKWKFPEASYTILTTQDGLPTNIITDLTVDNNDLLWISTHNGLVSFDGTYFTTFDLSDGLPSMDIVDLSTDNDGILWVATAKGVASHNKGRFTYVGDSDGPGSKIANGIYFDMGNNLWVGTDNNGIYMKSPDEWKHYTTKHGLLVNRVLRIVQAWDRSLWAATEMGISRYDGRGWQTFSSSRRLGSFDAREIIATKSRLWFFTDNGVHASEGSDWYDFTEDQGLISNDVLSACVVSDDEVYVGTNDGLSVIKNGVIDNFFVSNAPVGYNNISIAVDDRDRVWVGTWETGLNMYDSGYWTQLFARSEKTLETVRSIVFGPDNSIVFNTTAGVVFEHENNWKTETRKQGVSSDDIRCGLFDTNGRYWAGTSTGLCFRNDRGQWKRFRGIHGLPSEDIWACAMDNDGVLWFGTAEGIVSVKDDELIDVTSDIGLEKVDVRSIAVDGDKVLFGTFDGKLIEYSGGEWDVFGSSYLTTDKSIFAILVDPDGTRWFGTNGDGIIGIQDGKKIHVTRENGLPSDYVNALAYSKNTLWASCYGGVASIESK